MNLKSNYFDQVLISRPWTTGLSRKCGYLLKTMDPFGGPWIPASPFKSTNWFGGQWIHASQFQNTDRFVGSWIPSSKYVPIWWFMDPCFLIAYSDLWYGFWYIEMILNATNDYLTVSGNLDYRDPAGSGNVHCRNTIWGFLLILLPNLAISQEIWQFGNEIAKRR